MRSKVKKSTTTTATATQAARESFFGKQAKGVFFNSANQTNIPFIQAKLTINEPGDRYEQEADEMADQVVQRLAGTSKEQEMPSLPITGKPPAPIQSKCDECGQEEQSQGKEAEGTQEQNNSIQRMEESISLPTSDVDNYLSPRLQTSKGSGSPLPKGTRADMELAFGADLSGVRIHTDGKAANLNKNLRAQAFTHGNEIYFNEGKFDTGSDQGKKLLAHELTHTIQQGANKGLVQRKEVEKINYDPGDKYLRMRMKYSHLSGMEFHKKFKNKRWYKAYMEHYTSPVTGWDIKQKKGESPVKKTFEGSTSGTGSNEEVLDLGQSSGILEIEYDMYSEPDRMRIEDASSGKKIFDTNKKVSGERSIKIEFDLGKNTKIKVLVNPKAAVSDSDFEYKINVKDKPSVEDTFYNIEKTYPDPR